MRFLGLPQSSLEFQSSFINRDLLVWLVKLHEPLGEVVNDWAKFDEAVLIVGRYLLRVVEMKVTVNFSKSVPGHNLSKKWSAHNFISRPVHDQRWLLYNSSQNGEP